MSFEPYWWETQERVPSPNYDFPENVDVLVIGAGYTGLSAGIVANDLGAKTLIIDAEAAGEGASTRNGGMLGAHPRVGWDQLALNFGKEIADQIFKESSESLTFVRNLISQEGIDCNLIQSGRLQLAWSQKDHEKQKKLASLINEKSDINVKIVSKYDLANEIKTGLYFGGILFEDHCGINPMKFHTGLINALKKRGVPLIEYTPVFSIKRKNDSFIANLRNKSVIAKKVIMATNGYTKHDFTWFKKRVFPVPSFLIATEDLPAELIKELSPRSRMMVETRAKYSYYRVSPNGKKIIFGGRAAMKPIPLIQAAQRLRSSLDEIWPELKSYKLSNVWTGYTGFSFNHIPNVGNHDGIHYAMGYSGSGTALAAYLGAKAAYQAFDDPRGDTGYSHTKFRTRFFHIFEKPHFLSVTDFWYRSIVDRVQRR